MRLSRSFLATASFLLCSTLPCSAAAAQRARMSGPPESNGRTAGPAYVAARYLPELETTPPNAGVFVTGDLDGDGDLDLLACERPFLGHAPTGIQTWLNGGRGDFQFAHLLAFDPWSYSDHFDVARRVFLADVTGDGVLDLAYDVRDAFGILPSGVLVNPGL